MEALRLDGNAAAGLLSEVFAGEVTTATPATLLPDTFEL